MGVSLGAINVSVGDAATDDVTVAVVLAVVGSTESVLVGVGVEDALSVLVAGSVVGTTVSEGGIVEVAVGTAVSERGMVEVAVGTVVSVVVDVALGGFTNVSMM